MATRARLSLPSILCLLLVAGVGPAARAASINYGDFGPDYPPGIVIYQDVQESSGTDPIPPPRFGAPTLTVDQLDFDPTEFVASATGGGSDITDVQLNFDLMVFEVNDVVAGGLTSLLLSESGDYTLFGAGTALTSVAAGISLSIQILEVDGMPITPIDAFASNSITRDLVSDGPVQLAPWSNGVLFEFGPLLAANQIEYTYGVTKARIAIDDQLIAISEPESVAFIAKKDFRIEPGGVPNGEFSVPEPSAAVLFLALGLAGCGMRASLRRGVAPRPGSR
jgi:hypothetical protein